MKFNLHDKLSTLNEHQLQKIEDVRKEQKKYGMQFRNDSILTYNFAIGNVPDYLSDSKTIAHELFIVDLIFQKTNYGDIIEDVMREIAYTFKFKYRLPWNVTWEMVRFYIPDMLKMYCVRKYNLNLDAQIQY